MGVNERKGKRNREEALSSRLDLSLPDVTVRVTASRITAFCFKLKLSASFSSSPSFFFSLFLRLLPVSSYLLYVFFSSSIHHFQLFLEHASKSRTSSPPIVSALNTAWFWDPSLLLSLSPLSRSLSSPCCDRAHLLDLGYTRSESNYLIGPCSHSTVSSPHSTGFLGVKLISALSALLLLRTGRLNL